MPNATRRMPEKAGNQPAGRSGGWVHSDKIRATRSRLGSTGIDRSALRDETFLRFSFRHRVIAGSGRAIRGDPRFDRLEDGHAKSLFTAGNDASGVDREPRRSQAIQTADPGGDWAFHLRIKGSGYQIQLPETCCDANETRLIVSAIPQGPLRAHPRMRWLADADQQSQDPSQVEGQRRPEAPFSHLFDSTEPFPAYFSDVTEMHEHPFDSLATKTRQPLAPSDASGSLLKRPLRTC